MALKGKIIKKCVSILSLYTSQATSKAYAVSQQKQLLKRLLETAEATKFGKHFDFRNIKKESNIRSKFSEMIPVFNYESYLDPWLNEVKKGVPHVIWPGVIKYFALTSGTTSDSSKRIPISDLMRKSLLNTSLKHFYTLKNYDLPPNFYEKEILLLGGSTLLSKVGKLEEGDLSGIMTQDVPLWLNSITRPGKDIAKEKSWVQKIDKIVELAPTWDVGMVAGVPSWLLLLFNKLIDTYNLNNIHELWPNFRIYAHGGTSLTPYKGALDQLMGQPIFYSETYLASEGFFGYQKKPNSPLTLAINDNIYYEFIELNQVNFNDNILSKNHTCCSIENLVNDKDYVVLISNASGLWRYMVGDIISFSDVDSLQFEVKGRLSHFVNLCGEHLTEEELCTAVTAVQRTINQEIREFTFYAELINKKHIHHWFLAADKETISVSKQVIINTIDTTLKQLNDDYATVRAIKIDEVRIHIMDLNCFYDWMHKQGKLGGQNKFPRVLNDDKYQDWRSFLNTIKTEVPNI